MINKAKRTSVVGMNYWLPLAAALLAAVISVKSSAAENKTGVWREAFQSSPADYESMSPETKKKFAERLKLPLKVLDIMDPKPPVTGTLRFRFAVSAGGTQVRIRLSNEEGKTPLVISAASVGFAADGYAAQSGSLKALTFGGKSSISIPAGAPVVSDPVALAVSPGTELVASVYSTEGVQLKPLGGGGIAVAAGDQTLRDGLEAPTSYAGRPLVTGAEVLSVRAPRVIVTLGDSITDGNRQKVGELRGWPEQLARRLAARKTAVVNAGIGGNRVLASGSGVSALARLDRDVLRIEGVSHLIVLEGTNDIGFSGQSLLFGDNPPITAEDLIAGYRQIIARAHARGIKVVLGTITPFGASPMHYSPEHDQLREAVNQWIRTSKEADAVIDFDQVARDPAQPTHMRKEFGSGDGLHPGEAGYKAMGDAIDLSLLE